MLLRNKRPAVVANWIRMMRSHGPGCFVVVEGSDDRTFCQRYFDKACRVVEVNGKENVLEVIRILDEWGFAGVLGIVDPDFDILEEEGPVSSNVVTWGVHDLEVSLVCSPVLDRLVREIGSETKVQALDNDVSSLLLSTAAPVGYLRWLSKKQGLDLKFQGFNLSLCISKDSLALDVRRLCRDVKNRSGRPELDEEELKRRIEDLEDVQHDVRQVCCGDDVMQVLSVGLRKMFGTGQTQDVRVERLKQSLRLAFEDVDFRDSEVARSIREWQGRNPGFLVLKSKERLE